MKFFYRWNAPICVCLTDSAVPAEIAYHFFVFVFSFRTLILYDIIGTLIFIFIWAASQWAIKASLHGSPPIVLMIDIVAIGNKYDDDNSSDIATCIYTADQGRI